MIRWLRVVLPPLPWLAGFAVLYGVLSAITFWVQWRFGQRFLEAERWALTVPTLIVGTLCYGAWRAIVFHPLDRPGYEKWLAATPWTSRKPLPLGPVHLVLQDVVLVACVVAVAWIFGDRWAVHLPALFLGIYLALLGRTLFYTSAWQWGYGVTFGLGLMAWLWHDLAACFIATLATYSVGYLGLRRSLACFPWDSKWTQDLRSMAGMSTDAQRLPRSQYGWPFGRLAPTSPALDFHVPLHHAFLMSLLAGWCTFIVISLTPNLEDERKKFLIIVPVVASFASILRLLLYSDGYWAPISLFGRLATGRWLIWRYDQVFLAPVLTLVAGFSLPMIASALTLDPLFAAPIGIAVVLFICLGTGPSLKAWRLTGGHRITEGTLRSGTVKVG